MPWGETWALYQHLITDPTSAVAVAVHGLAHPLSREGYTLADLYDVLLSANWADKHRRPKPYPRPTDKPPPRLGNPGRWTQTQIRAVLAVRGHGPQPVPAPAARLPHRDKRGRFTRAP